MMAWRHDFHAIPELGFEETRTATRVAELLQGFGVEVHTGFGGTGVVGVLDRGDGPSIGLRADMDALPIHEQTNLPYASKTQGKMHACGHDGHTTMLLGAAKHLAESDTFHGRVVFIFQPNEEHGFGARAMLDDGLFRRFPVDLVYGIHNMPGLPVGSAAMRAGAMTASEALFEIEVNARGGHSALPHMGVDAITVGAQIVDNLQTIVSRKLNPGLNGVVSITEFETDGRRNVLPGRAVLRGDARALTPETNAEIERRMHQIVAGIAGAHDVQASVSYETGFIPTTNAPEAVKKAAAAAKTLFSDVDDACEPKLFSEDFAHLAAAAPGCFLLLGNGTDGANARPLHSADYDFNDDLLVPGSSYWVRLVEHFLGGKSV